nr:hypothetical protein [Tanacetum cinerariifolium]
MVGRTNILAVKRLGDGTGVGPDSSVLNASVSLAEGTGGSDNHRSSNNYSGSNNRNSGNGRDQRNRGHQSNRSANSDNSSKTNKLFYTSI